MADDVTVIVPTRNNQRTIRACLESVVAQDHPATTLIVVDNHSTDGTDTIAREYCEQVLTAGPERSAQRNLGVRTANTEWILWLDSDMVLPPDTVSSALAAARAEGAVGVALPERTIGPGFWTACRALERSCYLSEPWLHNPRLIRRDYLLAAGGFDLGMSGPEDADLRMRMHRDGAVIALAPVLVDHDEGRLTLADIARKRFYYGRSIPRFARANRGAVSAQGRAVTAAYAHNWRILLRHPVRAAGMVTMRAMEALAYAAGSWRGRRTDAG